MSKRLEVYKCAACGLVVETVSDGCTCDEGCVVSCCGAPMEHMVENTVDAAKEKHVPVVEKVAGGYKVTVGGVAHPMEETHWIMWIDLIAGGKVYRQYLNPGDAPEAFFPVEDAGAYAREYCNLHGLWKGE